MTLQRLPVTSAVGHATTAMEAAASVKSTTTVEAAAIAAPVELAAAMEAVAAAEAAAMEALATAEPVVTPESATAMPFASAPPSTFTTESLAAAKSVMVSIPTSAIVAAPSAIIATAVVATEPRPRADEHATDKIVRPIVAVRRAGIRRIIVIPVNAIRGRAIIAWADSYKNLGMCSACSQKHADPDQNRVL
jgi:hypothetical protein